MRVIAGLLILAMTIPVSLGAHHSFAAVFDDTKPVKLQGAVTKVEWMNPHVWFYLDVKDASGAVVKWQCEGGNPNTLLRQGWTRTRFRSGHRSTSTVGGREMAATPATRVV